MILTERDRALFGDLLLVGVMTRSQIQQRYFGSVQRCNNRLRRLFDWKFLNRYFSTYAPFGSEAIYTLGQPALSYALHEVDSRYGLQIAGITCRSLIKRPALSLMDHALAISDVYIALSQRHEIDGVALEAWLPELLCREEYQVKDPLAAGKWRAETFNPDAYVQFRSSNQIVSFFVEVDLGNTNSRQFRRKIEIHSRFASSDLACDAYGPATFSTLVVTTSENRMKNLSRLCADLNSYPVWFTTFEQLKGKSEQAYLACGGRRQLHLREIIESSGKEQKQ